MQTSTTENLTVSRTAEIRQLTAEAKMLYVEAEVARMNVEAGAQSALEKAWQCGKRLNAIKGIVGHGNWMPWLSANLPEWSPRRVQEYMRLDTINPKAKRVTDLAFDSIRKHRLTFVPDKTEPNKSRDVKFPRSVGLGNIVNEFNKLRYRHVNGLQPVDYARVKKETTELYQWLQHVHGDRADDPWKQKAIQRR